MIRLVNLTKVFKSRQGEKYVAKKIDAIFPTGSSVALLGRNGAGKSTLLHMIAGNILPTSGQILSDGTISWPVGYAGSFHKELTGEQNVRFIARIYGMDTEAMCDFVSHFADVGPHFRQPFRTYSSGMRARLAFGTSMAIPFGTYLIDEVTAVGDTKFKRKSKFLLKARLRGASAIFVSHSSSTLRDFCDAGAVLENGKLTFYPDLEEAIAHHEESMAE
ncbi:ABC transporter ATP-binding protein [Paracoccus sp. TK19116]|uniref:ABC transporter ATP-binding protein n=1 Tax=Paracoccus albicereus TaxID=2922394 RepID=A0ABT1MTF0_9RHOB|nr:ABC transporter ATP-binding protein [Paracoccus albicereus]MCQ0970141.1 ABC transporter ATP-binding protein [Paracoccus albicereus]